jgi:hypothetical protein
MAAIDEKRRVAADRIAALKEGGSEAWESAGDRIGLVLDDLERAIDEAWKRMGNP